MHLEATSAHQQSAADLIPPAAEGRLPHGGRRLRWCRTGRELGRWEQNGTDTASAFQATLIPVNSAAGPPRPEESFIDSRAPRLLPCSTDSPAPPQTLPYTRSTSTGNSPTGCSSGTRHKGDRAPRSPDSASVPSASPANAACGSKQPLLLPGPLHHSTATQTN